ncbi:gamma-butyrobetaine dioxygenase-like [Tachypleus tridentatus]|uniref:gamma-butyrobetaine dioxygenase-like n=1 Tax=Tachypleus tridentatus TaxID=6853 RepID=UPI003FD4115E
MTQVQSFSERLQLFNVLSSSVFISILRFIMQRFVSQVFRRLKPTSPTLTLYQAQVLSIGVSIKNARPKSTGVKITEVLHVHDSQLRVVFNDNNTCDFSNIWLRDSCLCPKCVHPETRQKLIDVTSLDINIQPSKFYIKGADKLEIEWPPLGKEKKHTSVFSADWLHEFLPIKTSGEHELIQPRNNMYTRNKPQRILWNKNPIEETEVSVEYSDLMESKSTLKQTVKLLLTYGIALVRGVPIKVSQTVEVGKRFACVRESVYGVSSHIIQNLHPDAHLGSTGRELEPHTDLAYRERSPGALLLHCLHSTDPDIVGQDKARGKSSFVDGYSIAEWLRENHPDHFTVLCSTPVLFSHFDAERDRWYRAEWPIITTDKAGDIQEIHYSGFSFRAPLLSVEKTKAFYSAYQTFSSKIADFSMSWTLYLKPGDLAIFHNRRILHGRESFDPNKVFRFLQGCYVDWDELEALYEHLHVNV